MSPATRLLARLWPLAPVAACAFLVWSAHVRIRRVEYVSGLEGRSGAVPDARSATGYSGGQRELILPGRSEAAFHWIAETQQMLALGTPHVRTIDYENAPFGRDVTTTSPVRWWLGFLAVLRQWTSGRPAGICVEEAALYSEPVLHILLVLAASAVALRRFGGLSAALVAVGLVTLHPLASAFPAGIPAARGLSCACALGSVLALLSGAAPSRGAGARPLPWFIASAVLGGIGIWVSARAAVPFVAGIAAGGALAAVLGRGSGLGSLPWRAWGLTGALTVLAACLAEYPPGALATLSLESLHPLYGLAWLGAGEGLEQLERLLSGREVSRVRAAVGAALLLALAAALLLARTWGFLSREPTWARLGGLPEAPAASSLWAWIGRDGASAAVLAALAPLGILAAAAPLLGRGAAPAARRGVALALGPVAGARGFACALLDAAALALLVVVAGADGGAGPGRAGWAAAAALALAALGFPLSVPSGPAGAQTVLTPAESKELVARHLAHWLARRSGSPGMVVFAPPDETTLLSYYGGLRGIGTYAPENTKGFAATLALAGARTMGEVQGQIEGRGIRYLLIPSWDPFFEDFARLYLVDALAGRKSLFAGELRRLELPLWLRPVPYQLPVGGAFEGQSVLVLEVVDPQSPAALSGRVAEYLVESGDLPAAAASVAKLRGFPGDVGALTAEAQVESAVGDSAAFRRTLGTILARLGVGADRYLPWDRRVSLAIVLARADRAAECRGQVTRCLEGVNEERLRSLSTGSLYALLVLSRTFGLEIADPGLRDLALELLPVDVRSRL
jgi:hypothetical protein